MEKSKSEQYLERLQKWKEQKRTEKEEKVKNKPRPYDRRPTATAAVKPFTNFKAGMKSVKSVVIAGGKTNACKKNRTSILPATVCSTNTQPKSGVPSKRASKTEKKRKSGETRELLEKLNKWREKKSEKKESLRSVVRPQAATREADKSRYKQVKSRLFDYQNKPKPHSTLRDKENVNIDSCGKAVVMSKTAGSKTEDDKKSLKRRHSEIQKTKTQAKPVGILKRKSCIGSFDFTDEEGGISSVKRRRQSNSTTDLASNEDGLDNCSDKKSGTSHLDASKPQLPTAVVTPGMSMRNVRFTTPPNGHVVSEGRKLRKTPKTPSTRSAELSDWLKAKGRTPSKYRHLMCFHGEPTGDNSQDPHTKNTLSVDELSEQMDVLEQERFEAEAKEKMHAMLDECMKLFEDGCPMESIVPWLDDIYKRIPCSKTSARYYTCKANVIKYSLDLDAVLEIFEQATIHSAQPKEEIARCLTDTLKYVTEEKVKQAKTRCYTPRRKEVQEENVFESTAVVYTVSNVTPFSERKRSAINKMQGSAQCQVVTPVRRSTRRSLQHLPESLKDKKKSFSNLDEIKGKDILFQPNLALEPVLATEEEL